MARGCLTLLAPAVCRRCEVLLDEAGPLCSDCRGRIRWTVTACSRCAMPIAGGTRAIAGAEVAIGCSQCSRRPPAFDRALAAGVYSGPLRRLILAHKFQEDRAARAFLVRALRDTCRRRGFRFSAISGYWCITSVPTHFLKRIQRGRDPARELAEDFARQVGRCYLPLLRKRRWTRAQADLSREQRQRNLGGAFRARRRVDFPRRVVLIDDVLTTAATASECAATLKAAGVEEVTVIVVARS